GRQPHWVKPTWSLPPPMSDTLAALLPLISGRTSSTERSRRSPPQFLPPPHRPSQINRPHKSLLAVHIARPVRGHPRRRVQVIVGAAGEDDDLEGAGFFDEEVAEPFHAAVVALDELVVEDDGGLEVLSEAE